MAISIRGNYAGQLTVVEDRTQVLGFGSNRPLRCNPPAEVAGVSVDVRTERVAGTAFTFENNRKSTIWFQRSWYSGDRTVSGSEVLDLTALPDGTSLSGKRIVVLFAHLVSGTAGIQIGNLATDSDPYYFLDPDDNDDRVIPLNVGNQITLSLRETAAKITSTKKTISVAGTGSFVYRLGLMAGK